VRRIDEFENHPHCQRGRLPAAGDDTAVRRRGRCLRVQVDGLRIVTLGKGLQFAGLDRHAAILPDIPDDEILEMRQLHQVDSPSRRRV
jgi:hypothetical protein